VCVFVIPPGIFSVVGVFVVVVDFVQTALSAAVIARSYRCVQACAQELHAGAAALH